MFLGRTKELSALLHCVRHPGRHAIVYGNRRIGKTSLILEAGKRCEGTFFAFECLKESKRSNLNALCSSLFRAGILPSGMEFSTFLDLFRYLDSRKQRLVLLIDEYPYLSYQNDKNEIDSEFQAIIDQYTRSLNLIFSGSHIGMMRDLLNERNPLFGRMNTILHLEEMNYLEASSFYPCLSPYQKASFYGVFGGSPFILKQIDPSKSLEENIISLFLNPDSGLYLHLSEGVTTDLAMKDRAKSILSLIGNSKLRYNAIEDKLHYDHNGLLSKQLSVLLQMGFIEKHGPINKKENSKKATYSIKSNALKFFYTFVYQNEMALYQIGPKAFFDEYVAERLTPFLSFRFEEIVRSFLSLRVKDGKLPGVRSIGTFYYDDPVRKKNGEFDVAVERKDGFDIIEAKFLKGKVDKNTVFREIEQIRAVTEIPIERIGFVSINGFEEDVPFLDYRFNGNDLYAD